MDEDCAWDCRDWGGGGWRVGFGVGVGVGVGLAAREVGERGLHLWVEGWSGMEFVSSKFGWMEVVWS